jgi:SWI/SNF-related matrix-associated actin-dependent regulator of chromatin subfamily A member 5
LGQTELFAHFLKLTDTKDEAMAKVLEEKEQAQPGADTDGYAKMNSMA